MQFYQVEKKNLLGKHKHFLLLFCSFELQEIFTISKYFEQVQWLIMKMLNAMTLMYFQKYLSFVSYLYLFLNQGTDIVTNHENNYFRLHLDQAGVVRTIVCLSRDVRHKKKKVSQIENSLFSENRCLQSLTIVRTS